MSDRITERASMYGPATCGCVALSKTMDAETMTLAQQAKFGEYRGWARCPICGGSGVDPRILASMAEGVTALREAVAACR